MVSKNVKKKKKKKKILNWENQTWYWEKRWLFLIGNGAEIRPLEMGRKDPGDEKVVVAKKELITAVMM